MAVVFDEVEGNVEPEPTQAAESEPGRAAAQQELSPEMLRRQLWLLECRAARLRAD